MVLLVGTAYALSEREVNSNPIFTKYESQKVSFDTANAFVAWCQYFHSQGIEFPEVVTAQCFLETSYLTSDIYRNGNNLFGIKYVAPKVGKHKYAVGIYAGHAKYLRKSMSVRHYRAYQARMLVLAKSQGRSPKSREDYFALLEDLPHRRGKRYAEDPNYIPKLRTLIARGLAQNPPSVSL